MYELYGGDLRYVLAYAVDVVRGGRALFCSSRTRAGTATSVMSAMCDIEFAALWRISALWRFSARSGIEYEVERESGTSPNVVGDDQFGRRPRFHATSMILLGIAPIVTLVIARWQSPCGASRACLINRGKQRSIRRLASMRSSDQCWIK